MDGGVQVGMAAHNGLRSHHSNGYDNPGYISHDSDYWEVSVDASGDHGPTRTQDSVKDVLLVIGDKDQRFGFSFIGGTDEGVPPTVDEMLPGSPADRADLEVGDEILEVNGNTLRGATHADVITFIQQSVKSRTICLRVKRRTITDKDPVSRRLKQAYVVANKEQTKARLNGLPNRGNVQVHDLTHAQQSTKENHIPKINGHVEKGQSSEVHSEPVTATQTIPVHAGITGSSEEPAIQAVRLKKDSDAVRACWGQLFPEEEINSDPDDPLGPVDYSELNFSDLDTYSLDSSQHSSEHNTSELLVSEPPIEQNVRVSNSRPIDFDKFSLESGPMTLNGDSMAAAAPEKNPSRKPPREVAVDCPPKFVAASGMKDPPPVTANQYHGVNGQATMTNGHPVLNGLDVVPNNQSNGEANKAHRHKDGTNFKVNNLSTSSSPDPSQNVPLLQPVSNAPLFDEKTPPAQDYTNNNKPIDVQELFSCLNEIQSKLNDSQDREDIQFLKQLFHNSDFQQALSLHNQVAEVHQKDPLPLPEAPNAEQLAAEIALSARDVRSPETEALRRIFADPHTKALLHAHDKIATRDPIQPSQSLIKSKRAAEAPSPAYRSAAQPTDGPDMIVRIQKDGNPLGATIVNDGDEVLIGRIIKGGMAERTGLLHEGDQILEINGMDVNGKTVDEISDMLADVDGTITFRVIPSREPEVPEQPAAALDRRNMVHVKALFKYDPEDDMYIPCKELGLSFEKGDILHIINQEDSNWWQAYRDGEDEQQQLAGLIPSKGFQTTREAMKKTLPDDQEPKKGCRCKRKKKKKSIYDAYTEDNDAEDRELYEEVGVYYASPERKRPIVLVGPPSVGIQELKQKLLEDDSAYKAAIPHTSRTRKNHEIDGMDYHFISRHQFEADIAAGKFVEYGELSKNLYGISLDAIATVVNEGKVCILKLHPQGVDCIQGMMGQGPFIRFLRTIKNSNLHPYFIFIAPPSLDRLRQQRTEAGELLKEEELRNIIEMGRSMEDVYGHYFDCVIIHYDHDRAYADLLTQIERVQREPQWVPIQWIHT